MTIFTFESGTRPGLFAFAADKTGTRLPERHGPWVASGKINADQRLPHGIKRPVVEAAIETEGFQMWRMKKQEEEQEEESGE